MINKWVKGNGYWCPKCRGSGRGEISDTILYSSGYEAVFYRQCDECHGQKRIAATVEQIISGTVPEYPGPEIHTCLSQCIEHRATKRGKPVMMTFGSRREGGG